MSLENIAFLDFGFSSLFQVQQYCGKQARNALPLGRGHKNGAEEHAILGTVEIAEIQRCGLLMSASAPAKYSDSHALSNVEVHGKYSPTSKQSALRLS